MKILNKDFITDTIRTGKCEFETCKGKSKDFFQCKLTEDFGGETCIWCQDCCDDGDDMIEESYKIVKDRNDNYKLV